MTTAPQKISRSTGSFLTYEFVDEESAIPIIGMFTTHDDTDENIFYLVDRVTGDRILKVNEEGLRLISNITSAAISTLEETMATREALDHARPQH